MSPEGLGQGVLWAQRDDLAANTADEDWISRSRVTAASLLLRDGDAGLKAQHQAWAEALVRSTLGEGGAPPGRLHPVIDYSPAGIACIGLLATARDTPTTPHLRALLETAAQHGAAMAQAIAVDATPLTTIHPRVGKGMLRMGLAGQIRPNRHFDEADASLTARQAARKDQLRALVDAELGWVNGDGPEPTWPAFPDPEIATRSRTIRLSDGMPAVIEEEETPEPEHDVNQVPAARWLALSRAVDGSSSVAEIRKMLEHFAEWTAKANGAGTVSDDERIQHPPREWTSAYLHLAATVMAGSGTGEIDHLVLDRLVTYPDDPFFDAVDAFLPTADGAHFNGGPLSLELLLHVRRRLIERLCTSRDWQWHIGRTSTGVTFHLGPAVAAIFIHEFRPGERPKCLLLPHGAERMDPLMESLCALTVTGASSVYVALLFLGTVEAKVLPRHLRYVSRVAAAWLNAHPSSTAFWVDHGVGSRLCQWLDAAMASEEFTPDADAFAELDRILNSLIQLGVAQATPMATALQRMRSA